eukprot:7906644-Pyramimonas_sp.AAC.1
MQSGACATPEIVNDAARPGAPSDPAQLGSLAFIPRQMVPAWIANSKLLHSGCVSYAVQTMRCKLRGVRYVMYAVRYQKSSASCVV